MSKYLSRDSAGRINSYAKRKEGYLRKLNMRTVLGIVAVLTMTFTLAVLPAHSDSIPPPGTFPTQFTVSGPNSDKIVYNIFADETGEFNALQSGQIDLTDTPLNLGNIATFCPSGSSFWCT